MEWELLRTGLVTHHKQHEADVASPLLRAPFTSDLTLGSVQLSALSVLDVANLSRSFYSICQLDKRDRKQLFSPLREAD